MWIPRYQFVAVVVVGALEKRDPLWLNGWPSVRTDYGLFVPIVVKLHHRELFFQPPDSQAKEVERAMRVGEGC